MKTNLEECLYFAFTYDHYEPLDWVKVKGNEDMIANILIGEEDTPTQTGEMFFAKVMNNEEAIFRPGYEEFATCYLAKEEELNKKRAARLMAKAKNEQTRADKYLLEARKLLELNGFKIIEEE